METIQKQARDYFPYMQSLRRDFHRHPELGFHEYRTAGIIARELKDLGLEVSTGIAETGVVAVLEGEQPGPVTLMRFDMDALPVQELTGIDFASETPGVMHACGHDGHMAVGLTVVKMLNERRDQIKGKIKFVFQPAEEGLGGAERMIEAGVLENPRVDTTLSMHLWNEIPVGTIAITPGPLMAGAEIFHIKVHGKGGHGALPHTAVDPILATAQIINLLQTIVSRNVSPLEAGVVSVCKIRAGETFNVIPPSAEFSGTIRTFEPAVRERVLQRFTEVVQGTAQTLGCSAEIDLTRLTPAVINQKETAEKIQEAAKGLSGLSVQTDFHTMVSEDMAFMMEKVPGCYLMIGSANPEKGLNFAHHHPQFNFDEEAMIHAAAAMVTAVLAVS
jgi:amidohydrolase